MEARRPRHCKGSRRASPWDEHMTVAELIAALQKTPQEAEVLHHQRETEECYAEDIPIWRVDLDGDVVIS